MSNERLHSRTLLLDTASQVLTRAAGSLLCRHDYSSVCAAVFPHVVRDMVEQAESFSGDAEVSEAINRGEVVSKMPGAGYSY